MPQGLEAVVRQLQASESEGAEPDREVCEHVAVRIKGLGTVPGPFRFRVPFQPVSFKFAFDVSCTKQGEEEGKTRRPEHARVSRD